MTPIPWILDGGMLERSVGQCNLQEALERAGTPHLVARWEHGRWTLPGTSWAVDFARGPDKFVTWGSMEFCKYLMKELPGRGIYFGHTDRTQYLTYASEMPEVPWLNHDALAMTYAQLRQRRFMLEGIFGGTEVFLRPNSGYKTFAGQTVKYEGWDESLRLLDKSSSVMADTLIIAAGAKNILGEFRFVVAGGRVVAGSEYRWDGVLDVRRDWPPECMGLAEAVAKNQPWQLDAAYVVDVALTGDGPRVVELNSWCHAGLYACDSDAVVTAISELARGEL